MAYKGKQVVNRFTKQTIEFVVTAKDSKGEILEIISTWQARSPKPAQHYHPFQEEYFKVLEGEIHVELNGKTIVAKKNDSFKIDAGTVHAMWNASGSLAKVNWKAVPALNTEYLLETANGLASDKKIGKKNLPQILQAALLLKKYNKEFRLTKPPFAIQLILMPILVVFALLAGKKASYDKYIN